jgi:predicted nucleic acid-binding protein
VTGYVESSALLKLYVDEPETAAAAALTHQHEAWTTGRHTLVEVRRNLARVLTGADLVAARAAFDEDWRRILVVELDRSACDAAARLAESTGVRTLDALHLGAAEVAGAADGLPLITFDGRLAVAARSLGWRVLPQ